MNSKTEELLAIARRFEQDTENAEASLIADIVRIVAEKDFSGLIGLRDRMVRDENPNFHPFRIGASRLSEEEKELLEAEFRKSAKFIAIVHDED